MVKHYRYAGQVYSVLSILLAILMTAIPVLFMVFSDAIVDRLGFGVVPLFMSSYIGGAFFLILGIILKRKAETRFRRDHKTKTTGAVVQGIVRNVRKETPIPILGKRGYVIYYSYVQDGLEKNEKSYYYWKEPAVLPGQTINVRINEIGESVLDITV